MNKAIFLAATVFYLAVFLYVMVRAYSRVQGIKGTRGILAGLGLVGLFGLFFLGLVIWALFVIPALLAFNAQRSLDYVAYYAGKDGKPRLFLIESEHSEGFNVTARSGRQNTIPDADRSQIELLEPDSLDEIVKLKASGLKFGRALDSGQLHLLGRTGRVLWIYSTSQGILGLDDESFSLLAEEEKFLNIGKILTMRGWFNGEVQYHFADGTVYRLGKDFTLMEPVYGSAFNLTFPAQLQGRPADAWRAECSGSEKPARYFVERSQASAFVTPGGDIALYSDPALISVLYDASDRFLVAYRKGDNISVKMISTAGATLWDTDTDFQYLFSVCEDGSQLNTIGLKSRRWYFNPLKRARLSLDKGCIDC